MNYDKMSYLFWSIIVLMLILGASVMSNYGRSLINDQTFKMFFGWYTVLVIVNFFNILLNLVYHYFMNDLQGLRGLKGEVGDRGLPGKDEKCGCSLVTDSQETSDGFDIDDADKIITKTVELSYSPHQHNADFNIEVEEDSPLKGQTGSIIVNDALADADSDAEDTGAALTPAPAPADTGAADTGAADTPAIDTGAADTPAQPPADPPS